jgi:predicted transcriptional regulator
MAAPFGSIFSRMKTITFKADERLEAQLTRLAERLGTSRSGVIRDAVCHYERQVQRTDWAARIREASLKSRDEIARTSADFAAANADGL